MVYTGWLFKESKKKKYRYVVGEVTGPKPLICIGINPSFATPQKLDTTTTIVRNFAQKNGFDGWIMLNVYPQYSTDPNGIEETFNPGAHRHNLEAIEKILKDYPKSKIWVAFGCNVFKRDFLVICAVKILKKIRHRKLYYRQSLTKDGAPHHPLGTDQDAPLKKFDVTNFLNNYGK